MRMVKIVGGSLDDGEVGIPDGLSEGGIMRLPARDGHGMTEAYELRSDGKLHLVGYKTKPMQVPDGSMPEEQLLRLAQVSLKVAESLRGLEQFVQENGYIPEFRIGNWQLRLVEPSRPDRQQE